MNWTHGLKIHTYAKQNPRSLQNQSIYIHTEIELSYTTKLKKKISRTKTITQDLICHNRTPLERERERDLDSAVENATEANTVLEDLVDLKNGAVSLVRSTIRHIVHMQFHLHLHRHHLLLLLLHEELEL